MRQCVNGAMKFIAALAALPHCPIAPLLMGDTFQAWGRGRRRSSVPS